MNKARVGTFRGDFLGALTSVLVSLPGNIVYGMIAFAPLGTDYIGAGILAGMFSSIFAGFFAAWFGGTPVMVTGPQAPGTILFAAILTKLLETGDFALSNANDVSTILALTFMAVLLSGIFQLIFGSLRLGGLVKYISYPVIVGIINGTAILMIVSQLSLCFGMPKQSIWETLKNLDQVQPFTLLVAIVTIVLMMRGKKWIPHVPSAILAIIGGTLLYYVLHYTGNNIALGPTIGEVPTGTPSLQYLVHGFQSIDQYLDWTYLSIIVKGAMAIAIIGSIDSLLSAATLQSITNHRTNANRELIGQGIGNVASGLFGGLAGVGFMGRSIVSYHAGARTRYSSMMTSVILLIAIMLLAQFIGYIPQVVMGAVVVVLAIQIIDPWSYQLVRDLFQKKVSHRQRLVTNLLVILLVMIVAIFIDFMLSVGVGIVVSIGLFVQNMSKSIVKHVYFGTSYHSKKIRHEALQALIKQHGKEIAVIELEGSIFFGASDTLVDQIDKLVDQGVKYLILDFKRVNHIDATGYKIFEQNYNRLKQFGCTLSFCYFSEQSKFWSEIQDFGLNKVVPSHLFFIDTDQALEYFEDELLKSLNANVSEDFEFTFKGFFNDWDFTEKEIEVMYGYVEKQTYQMGELLFRAGDLGNSMYLLAKGIADIFIVLPTSGRMKRISTITYGTVFGEMALLDEKPRSASIRAATDLICYRISTENFSKMKENHPMMAMKFYLSLCKILVNRLRDADNLISELEA